MTDNLPATAGGNLPAMYDGAASIGGDSIRLPGIYLCHDLSDVVKSKYAEPGDVVVKTTTDDPEPRFLIGGDSDNSYFDAFIIGVHQSFARFESGDMEWLTEDEFRQARNEGDRNAWPVFRYTVSIPEFDQAMPASLMLTRMAGKGAYEQINSMIKGALIKGETDKPVVARLSVRTKKSRDGKHEYYAWVAKPTPKDDLTKDEFDTAQEHRQFVQADSAPDGPAPVSDQPGI